MVCLLAIPAVAICVGKWPRLFKNTARNEVSATTTA
jgi:hypothetical protein